MNTCDNCSRQCDVIHCTIIDDMGKRYRNLCDECIITLGKNSRIEFQKDSPKTDTSQIAKKLETIIITTGTNFEGYKITSYIDVIFDERVSGIGIKTSLKSLGDIFASLTGDELFALSNRISELKSEIINNLKLKAIQIGANAILGLDFETTICGTSSIMVSVNGTAVVIESCTNN